MQTAFSIRLRNSIERTRSVLCVGLDPRWDSLPLEIRGPSAPAGLVQVAAAYSTFCRAVIDLVADSAACVKPQAAFFEACGSPGYMNLDLVLRHAKGKGVPVIFDSKRGDISTTGEAYAQGVFGGVDYGGRKLPAFPADAMTVAPYMGEDSVKPFLDAAKAAGGGLFVLCRTSNPGSGLFQNLVSDGKPLYRHVADSIVRWNEPTKNETGYGDIGAVVGATHPNELNELRAAMPGVWFLVPGFGAQGGSAEDVRNAFDGKGLGAVVNSSRGITFCYKPDDADWRTKIVEAVKLANAQLNAVRK